jgi:hypothetical protein
VAWPLLPLGGAGACPATTAKSFRLSIILWSPKMRVHPPTHERITQRFCISMIGEAENSPSRAFMHHARAKHTQRQVLLLGGEQNPNSQSGAFHGSRSACSLRP